MSIITPGCMTQLQTGIGRARSLFQRTTAEGWRLDGVVVEGARVFIVERPNPFAGDRGQPDFIRTCVLEVPQCPKKPLYCNQVLTKKGQKATIEEPLSSINGCDRYRVNLCDC